MKEGTNLYNLLGELDAFCAKRKEDPQSTTGMVLKNMAKEVHDAFAIPIEAGGELAEALLLGGDSDENFYRLAEALRKWMRDNHAKINAKNDCLIEEEKEMGNGDTACVTGHSGTYLEQLDVWRRALEEEQKEDDVDVMLKIEALKRGAEARRADRKGKLLEIDSKFKSEAGHFMAAAGQYLGLADDVPKIVIEKLRDEVKVGALSPSKTPKE